MLPPDQATIRNQLLRRISFEDFEALQPHFERIEVAQHAKFTRPNAKIERVYFPEDGVISVIAHAGDDLHEIGIIGCDGAAGAAIVAGADRTPYEHLGQVTGYGYAVNAEQLMQVVRGDGDLRDVLTRYLYVFSLQASSTATAYALYQVEARLARWLLMCQDRVGDEVALTHEFLSLMLAIRRPSVTFALQAVQLTGAITTTRGRIRIVDRGKLLQLAGKSYGMAEDEYRRLFGADVQPAPSRLSDEPAQFSG